MGADGHADVEQHHADDGVVQVAGLGDGVRGLPAGDLGVGVGRQVDVVLDPESALDELDLLLLAGGAGQIDGDHRGGGAEPLVVGDLVGLHATRTPSDATSARRGVDVVVVGWGWTLPQR